jgi:hypothetical protein
MGLFRREKTPATPSNPAMTELGRDYAIAKRHGDRKEMRRITREIGSNHTGTDLASFEEGQQAYDAIPPAYSKPRRGKRR